MKNIHNLSLAGLAVTLILFGAIGWHSTPNVRNQLAFSRWLWVIQYSVPFIFAGVTVCFTLLSKSIYEHPVAPYISAAIGLIMLFGLRELHNARLNAYFMNIYARISGNVFIWLGITHWLKQKYTSSSR